MMMFVVVMMMMFVVVVGQGDNKAFGMVGAPEMPYIALSGAWRGGVLVVAV